MFSDYMQIKDGIKGHYRHYSSLFNVKNVLKLTEFVTIETEDILTYG